MSYRHARAALLTGAALVLASCGGGGGSDDSAPAPITSFELLDPNPGAGNRFGQDVAILANGNVVVTAPRDSTVAPNSGAVHLYNPRTQARIASIFGDTANDRLGSSVTALANGNFVIASPNDDVGGVVDAGSVMLINGATGAQIGSTIAGGAAGDRLGSRVTALANGNFAITSPSDVGGVVNAGSVMLFNGATGAQIGSTIAGTAAGDVIAAEVAGSATGDFYVLGLGRADKNGVVDSGLARVIAQ